VPSGEPVAHLPGLQIVVDDVDAARAELAGRGVDVGPVVHFDGAGFVEGRGSRWNSFVFFEDVDGHAWGLQERPSPDDEASTTDLATTDAEAVALAWEADLARAWDSLDSSDGEAFRARIGRLAEAAPYGDGTGAFERAAAYDSTGRSDQAVPLYEEALAQGLTGIRRRRATIQLASSLRNLGAADEAVALLSTELSAPVDGEAAALEDAVRAFLALALVDVGRPREAASLALEALAPHLPRYQRSLGAYARDLR